MQKQNATPYLIGQYYEVPVVIIPKNQNWTFWGMKTVPVIGPAHNDDKLLNVNVGPHIHIDWRFAPSPSIKRIMHVINTNAPSFKEFEAEQYILGRVLAFHDFLIYGTARLRCKRDLPSYPKGVKFSPLLNQKYANVKFSGVCPHWGVDLSRIKPDNEGCITCPLHGLRFNLQTGRLAAHCYEK